MLLARFHTSHSPSFTCSTRSVGRLRSTQRAQGPQSSFPGEDAPGTGKRHFPSPVSHSMDGDYGDEFEKRTSAEIYALFPKLVGASCPLELEPAAEPAGLELLHQSDLNLGPGTGHRRRTNPVDSEAQRHADPRPNMEETRAARLRELEVRQGGDD